MDLQSSEWVVVALFVWSQFIIPRLFQLKPAHLIIVVKVVYPDVLLHVGVIKILPKPGAITPVEVPLSITVTLTEGEIMTD